MTSAIVLLIVIYLRVSTEDQAKHGYSLPDQRERCLAKAREVAGGQPHETIIIEDAAGGDILERPKLTELRDLIRQSKPHAMICMDPDRFSRELFIQLLVTREIEAAGTRLVFVQHNYENTPEGQFFYALRGAVSQFEKAKILDRTKRGMRGKLRQGLLANGVRPYGYDYDTVKDTLVVVPEEAAWVQQIYRWRAERVPPMEIRDRLIALGVPTKHGKTWRSSTIQGMLRNTAYTGQMRCHRWDCTGYTQQRQLPKHLRKGTIKPKQRPAEEWIIIPVPAIISEDLFHAVQAVLRTNKRQARKGAGLLSGLAVCGLCGSPVHYSQEKNGTHSLRCYHRSPRRDQSNIPAEPCTLPYQAAHHIEAMVWAELTDWLARPEELLRRLEREAQANPADGRLEEAQRLHSDLERALSDAEAEHADSLSLVMKKLVDRKVGETMLAEQVTRLENIREQLAAVDQRIANLTAQSQVSAAFRAQLFEVRERVHGDEAKVREVMADLAPEKRQHLLRVMVERVLILPGRRVKLIPNDPTALPRTERVASPT